jgi:hypothetical protein
MIMDGVHRGAMACVRPFCLTIDVERSDGEASMKFCNVPSAAIGLLPGSRRTVLASRALVSHPEDND